MNAVATATRISVDYACCGADIAADLHAQLSTGAYDRCSAMPLPAHIDEWRAEHRTARKRGWRAERKHYVFAQIDRADYEHDVYDINTSLAERQGRPMTKGYYQRPRFNDPPATCERHGVHAYGVLQRQTLVAYLWMYRAGDLALVSSILGHGAHLENDVMYLLVAGAIEHEIPYGGFLVYNRHDSGTDGLRFFKQRLGFVETEVEWAL